MPDELDGLAVGMALFEEEIEAVKAQEERAQAASARSASRLGRWAIKLSVVSALGFVLLAMTSIGR